MTNKFDSFLSSYIKLLTEAPISLDDSGSPETTNSIISQIVDNIMSSKGTTGHWVKVFKSKRISDSESREMVEELVREVVSKVFPERNNTFNPDLTTDELKMALQDAIRETFQINNTYSKFLADRFGSKNLLGKAKDVVVTGLSQEISDSTKATADGIQLTPVEKKVTQREEKNRLKKAVNKLPKKEKEVPFFRKAADLDSDDPAVAKAFQKLPEDKDFDEEEAKKMIGKNADEVFPKLRKSGGIIQIIGREKETDENTEVPALDPNDDDADPALDPDRAINPYFNTSKGSWKFED